MSEDIKRDEATLACERNNSLLKNLARKRIVSFALAISFMVIALLAWSLSFEMGSFISMVASLLLFLRYFDANSHLHEVRQRSTKKLIPDFSLLQPKKQAVKPDHSQAAQEQ